MYREKIQRQKKTIRRTGNTYAALREMIAKAEYWKSGKADERHAARRKQDIYTSAINLNGTLYSGTIKLDAHTQRTKEMAQEKNRNLEDYFYKDHKLIKIEIASTLSETTYAYESEGFQQAAKAAAEAISEESLGTLRGCVKPSLSDICDRFMNNGKIDKIRAVSKAKSPFYTAARSRVKF